MIRQLLAEHLPEDQPGGAIVYCATRRSTQDVADYLRQCGLAADCFHAGLKPEHKKDVQQRFVHGGDGGLRVIAATNAFGMGIDKPDVRLVIHADIPGSLENYLQEAGRAGRDREAAQCLLLHADEDVERQFGMSARARLAPAEIDAVLRALRRIDARRKGPPAVVVATSEEVLRADEEADFERDHTSDDTRVRTAIAWLEEAGLLERDENQVQVFSSSLRVASVEEAQTKIHAKIQRESYRVQLLRLVQALFDADATAGLSTDALMLVCGLSAEGTRRALHDLERIGVARNDTAVTAFVHVGAPKPSRQRLAQAAQLEVAMLQAMQQAAPDLARGETAPLNLRLLAQRLRDAEHPDAHPQVMLRLLRSVADDGRDEDGGTPSLMLRCQGETVQVKLLRQWSALQQTAQRRRDAAGLLLDHWLAQLPKGQMGHDLLAQTTLGALTQALTDDLTLAVRPELADKLLAHALMWLHEQEVVRLNKGLVVFRPAMTIRLAEGKRDFTQADFTPLRQHYDAQVQQIHIMAEYVRRGLKAMHDAERLLHDYFELASHTFLKRWLPLSEEALQRQTSDASWRAIVEGLDKADQRRIATDERVRTNVLVLAGPGAGKTRVLVHRIAYLVRVKRERPGGILALTHNRHAATQIRQRLRELIGDDARGITIMTCHALAMRLVGASFEGRAAPASEDDFDQVLRDATALLQDPSLSATEADAQREHLLAGWRWLLVDEYQDIGPEQYALIAALAGRTLQEDGARLSLFAVGDDDQNIYGFRGASVGFIRRFEADYKAKTEYLTHNHRASGHLIEAANAVIARAAARMKAEHPITIDRQRRRAPPGGRWDALDAVLRGRVHWHEAASPTDATPLGQALAAVHALQRLAAQDGASWDWRRVAVIARHWHALAPVQSCCAHLGVPAQRVDEDALPLWRLREVQVLVAHLRSLGLAMIDGAGLHAWLAAQPATAWSPLLADAAQTWVAETGGTPMPAATLTDWLAEWCREARRRPSGLQLLSAHRAKGLEFDHVVVLDGGWHEDDLHDSDAQRRLFYVAMTRARETLTLMADGPAHAQAAMLRGMGCTAVTPYSAPAEWPPALRRQLHLPGLDRIDLGWAGRLPASHRAHARLAALRPGDALTLVQTRAGWHLQDGGGATVGRMANRFAPAPGMVCRHAEAHAVFVRHRHEEQAPFQEALHCAEWAFVVPLLTWEPPR